MIIIIMKELKKGREIVKEKEEEEKISRNKQVFETDSKIDKSIEILTDSKRDNSINESKEEEGNTSKRIISKKDSHNSQNKNNIDVKISLNQKVNDYEEEENIDNEIKELEKDEKDIIYLMKVIKKLNIK